MGRPAPRNARNALQAHVTRLRRLLADGDRALDVGAGPGRFTIELARLGAQITVADLSPGQLELNRERVAEAGLEEHVLERAQAELPTADVENTGRGRQLRKRKEARVTTRASALGQGGATEIGERRLNPIMASSTSAASSAVRASGPCTPIRRAGLGQSSWGKLPVLGIAVSDGRWP